MEDVRVRQSGGIAVAETFFRQPVEFNSQLPVPCGAFSSGFLIR